VHQQVVGRHNLEFDLVSHELILEMLRVQEFDFSSEAQFLFSIPCGMTQVMR
jgi:hypothetical protein